MYLNQSAKLLNAIAEWIVIIHSVIALSGFSTEVNCCWINNTAWTSACFCLKWRETVMSSLTWKRQPELFKFDQRWHRCKARPPAYDGSLAAKEITTCRQKSRFRERKVARILGMLPQTTLLKACTAHESFPLIWFISTVKLTTYSFLSWPIKLSKLFKVCGKQNILSLNSL